MRNCHRSKILDPFAELWHLSKWCWVHIRSLRIMSAAKIPVPMNARWPKSKASKAIEGMSDDVEELKS